MTALKATFSVDYGTSSSSCSVTANYTVSNTDSTTSLYLTSFVYTSAKSMGSGYFSRSAALHYGTNSTYWYNDVYYDPNSSSWVSGTGATTTVNRTLANYTRGHSAYTVYLTLHGQDGADETIASTSFTVPAKPSYTVSYNANGGSGAPGNQTKWYGETLTLSSTRPTRSGYVFSHWNTASNGTGTTYNPGGSYTTNAALTLYAIWIELPKVTSVSATRVASDGSTADALGGRMKVDFSWSNSSAVSGQLPTSFSIRAVPSDSTKPTLTGSVSGNTQYSGSSFVVLGSSDTYYGQSNVYRQVYPDISYTITVTGTNSYGDGSGTGTLSADATYARPSATVSAKRSNSSAGSDICGEYVYLNMTWTISKETSEDQEVYSYTSAFNNGVAQSVTYDAEQHTAHVLMGPYTASELRPTASYPVSVLIADKFYTTTVPVTLPVETAYAPPTLSISGSSDIRRVAQDGLTGDALGGYLRVVGHYTMTETSTQTQPVASTGKISATENGEPLATFHTSMSATEEETKAGTIKCADVDNPRDVELLGPLVVEYLAPGSVTNSAISTNIRSWDVPHNDFTQASEIAYDPVETYGGSIMLNEWTNATPGFYYDELVGVGYTYYWFAADLGTLDVSSVTLQKAYCKVRCYPGHSETWVAPEVSETYDITYADYFDDDEVWGVRLSLYGVSGAYPEFVHGTAASSNGVSYDGDRTFTLVSVPSGSSVTGIHFSYYKHVDREFVPESGNTLGDYVFTLNSSQDPVAAFNLDTTHKYLEFRSFSGCGWTDQIQCTSVENSAEFNTDATAVSGENPGLYEKTSAFGDDILYYWPVVDLGDTDISDVVSATCRCSVFDQSQYSTAVTEQWASGAAPEMNEVLVLAYRPRGSISVPYEMRVPGSQSIAGRGSYSFIYGFSETNDALSYDGDRTFTRIGTPDPQYIDPSATELASMSVSYMRREEDCITYIDKEFVPASGSTLYDYVFELDDEKLPTDLFLLDPAHKYFRFEKFSGCGWAERPSGVSASNFHVLGPLTVTYEVPTGVIVDDVAYGDNTINHVARTVDQLFGQFLLTVLRPDETYWATYTVSDRFTTTTLSVQVPVSDYVFPAIYELNPYRIDETNALAVIETDDGTDMAVDVKWSIYGSLTQTEPQQFRVQVVSEEGETVIDNEYEYPNTVSGNTLPIVLRSEDDSTLFSQDLQYVVTVTVTDRYSVATLSAILTSAFFTLDVKRGGHGIAFGKPATRQTLDVRFPGYFEEALHVGEELSLPIFVRGKMPTTELPSIPSLCIIMSNPTTPRIYLAVPGNDILGEPSEATVHTNLIEVVSNEWLNPDYASPFTWPVSKPWIDDSNPTLWNVGLYKETDTEDELYHWTCVKLPCETGYTVNTIVRAYFETDSGAIREFMPESGRVLDDYIVSLDPLKNPGSVVVIDQDSLYFHFSYHSGCGWCSDVLSGSISGTFHVIYETRAV